MNRYSVIAQIKEMMRNLEVVSVEVIMAKFLCSKRTANEYIDTAMIPSEVEEDVWDKDPKDMYCFG